MLRERSSAIASFAEHTVYSIFKMYSVLILVFSNFNLLQLIQRSSAKGNFSLNVRCSPKEAVLLLRPWSTLYIAVSKCKLSWGYFFATFNRKCIRKKQFFLKEFPQKKQCYCFLHGAHCI